VGRKEDANGIGVDLERLSRKVPREVLLEVCTAPELAWVKGGKNSEDIHLRLRMLFSAKEAGFKAFFPVERVFLWFRDAELDWIARESCFSGRLLKSAGRDYPAGYRYSVGCMITQEFVFTYTMLPPSSSEEKHGGQA
jgi:4'-phosphopantetheinyl transferase EntD